MPAPAMALLLVGSIHPANPSASSFLDAVTLLAKAPPVVEVPVYVNSDGGLIAMGVQMGLALNSFRSVCYVERAASAALQVVMPGCGRVVFTERSTVGFHSAGWCVSGSYDAAKSIRHTRESLAVTLAMHKMFAAGFGETATCPAESKAWPEVARLPCNVQLMVNGTEMTGRAFRATFPGGPTPIAVVPEAEFPPKLSPTPGSGGDLCGT